MKIALAVNLVTPDTAVNLDEIAALAGQAAAAGAQVVCFGEAAATGLINTDDPQHDRCVGQAIPGPIVDRMREVSMSLGIWVAMGILECDGRRMYDAAVLLSPAGAVAMKYRRNDPRWHGRHAEPAIYCQGSEVLKAETEFGSFAFVICGDLWGDNVRRRVRALRPDWLLHPFQRSFSDGSRDQAKWEREELPEYTRLISEIGIPTFATSYISSGDLAVEGDAFGGAMVFSGQGEVIAQQPLGTRGILFFDTEGS